MMTTDTLRKFARLGIIRENTEITAKIKGVDLSGLPILKIEGTFCTQSIKILKDGTAFIEGRSIVDGAYKKIDIATITNIDGMEVDRVIELAKAKF